MNTKKSKVRLWSVLTALTAILTIAAIVGILLNAILPGNDYEFGVSVTGDKSADLGSY